MHEFFRKKKQAPSFTTNHEVYSPEMGEATYDKRGSKSLTINKPSSSLGQEPFVITDRYGSSIALASPVFMNLLHMILHRLLYFSGQKSCRKGNKIN